MALRGVGDLHPASRYFKEEDSEALRSFDRQCTEAFAECHDALNRNVRLPPKSWEQVWEKAESFWYSNLFECERPVTQPFASESNLVERVS